MLINIWRWNHWEVREGVLEMLMKRGLVTETTGWVLSSEMAYFKSEVLPKDNFMHWKLSIMGDHCCCHGACWSDIARHFYVHVHPCLSQGHLTGNAPSWPSRWRWSTAQWGRDLLLKIKMTASVGQMWLARLWSTDKTGCHLQEAWAALLGTQQLGAKPPEGVTLVRVMHVSSAQL